MPFSIDSITSGVSDFVKTAASRVGNVLDPSNARLSVAGLLAGGSRATQKQPETRVGFSVTNIHGTPIPIQEDWRVTIGVSEKSKLFYHSSDPGILVPLKETNGVVFPYTPSITTSYSASYSPLKATHNNYPAYYYEASEVQALQINGDFTVQTEQEGQYLLACIYFFRACTKMFYGSGNNAGNPPPLVFLKGFGAELFPNVPCVVTSFQHVMSGDVDYLEIPSIEQDWTASFDSGAVATPGQTSQGKGRTTRLPTASQLQVTLQPVYSRNRIAEFNLEQFAAGKLLDKGFL